MKLTVDVVEARGSYYEIGLEQGSSLTIPIFTELAEGFDLTGAKQVYKQFAPHMWEELEGIAEELGAGLDRIAANFSGYNLPFPEMGCTAMIKDRFYARNYDFSPEFYDARLVFIQPDHGYASVGFSQQATGRLDGMNEKGLVIGLHYVNQSQDLSGLAAPPIVRIILDRCQNTNEAVELLSRLPHAHSFNYSVTDASGNHVVIEASPEEKHVRKAATLFCTNHFQTKAFHAKNREDTTGSRKRVTALGKIAKENPDQMKAFEKFNSTESPLFFQDYRGFFGTLHTVLYSPEDLSITVGIGGNSIPFQFSLRKWLEGEERLPKQILGELQFD